MSQLHDALINCVEADKALAEAVKQLPQFDRDEHAAFCGEGDLYVIEPGLTRTTRYVSEENIAAGEGAEDVSDTGFTEWLQCGECDTAFAIPEGMKRW